MTKFKKLTKRILSVTKIHNSPFSGDFNKIKFVKLLKIYQFVFKLLGVVPYSGARRSLRYLQKAVCVLILAFVWAMCTVEIYSTQMSLSTLEKGIYISELFCYSLLSAAIYVYGFMHSKQFKDISAKLFRLYDQLQDCCLKLIKPAGTFYERLTKEVLVLGCCLFLFEIVCVYVNVAYRPISGWWLLRSFGAYNLPNILINLNLCLYWLALRSIGLLFSWANEILQDLHETPRRQSHSLSHASLWFQKEFYANTYKKKSALKVHEIFLALSQINSDLSDVLTAVVEIFRIILVLNFIASFLVLTIEFFTLYKYFDNPSLKELQLVSFKCIWLLLHSGRILFVLITNNAITTQKCRTLYILNGLPLEIFDSENNITQFLLQIMVRKHTETACGLVDLDLMFLLGIINGLAMYIIFLIQIDLGNVSISGSNTTMT